MSYMVKYIKLTAKSKYLSASSLARKTPSFTCVSRQLSIESLSPRASNHIDLHAAAMNGFNDRGMDEGDFGESKSTSVVKAFDAFRESSLLLSLLLDAP